MAPVADAVTVSLNDLKNGTVSFDALKKAFGPDGLGILLVKDLPEAYLPMRRHLLSYSSYLGNLPKSELGKLEHEKSMYLTGWSLGKETLKNGQADTLKGSYYANCAFYVDPKLECAVPTPEYSEDTFPEYLSPNVWPDEATLPGFKTAFEDLCRMVIDTAVLVAKACDRYAASEIEGYPSGYLEKMVGTSTTTKARLLHYYPEEVSEEATKLADGNGAAAGPPPAFGVYPTAPPNSAPFGSPSYISTSAFGAPAPNTVQSPWQKDRPAQNPFAPQPGWQTPCAPPADDTWCATHLDHGCLTGLTSAMLIDEAAPATAPLLDCPTFINTVPPSLAPLDELEDVPEEIKAAGLYIRSRTGETVQVKIPRDCLAFQTGEALERITGGRFRAVPHFVKQGAGKGGRRIARNTLAVFTQPELGEEVDRDAHLTFADFAREIVARNTAKEEPAFS